MSELSHFLAEFVTSLINSDKIQLKNVRINAFIEDVFEDLEQMDENRLVGLGVTHNELHLWQKAYHHHTD